MPLLRSFVVVVVVVVAVCGIFSPSHFLSLIQSFWCSTQYLTIILANMQSVKCWTIQPANVHRKITLKIVKINILTRSKIIQFARWLPLAIRAPRFVRFAFSVCNYCCWPPEHIISILQANALIISLIIAILEMYIIKKSAFSRASTNSHRLSFVSFWISRCVYVYVCVFWWW